VSLRARHPTSNLAILTQTLRIDPVHSWIAGEPRRSQSGALVGGQHRDSYWSAILPAQMVGASSMPLETFMSQQLVQLARHRECFSRLQADGGEISLLIELSPGDNAAFTVSSATARKLAELNIELELQFVAD
jgi:hypothetical protein